MHGIVETVSATKSLGAIIPVQVGLDFAAQRIGRVGKARMQTVELLEAGFAAAQQLGYNIRHEWLDGNGGGVCEFGGARWIFVDLAQNPGEQLDQVVEAIRNDSNWEKIGLATELRNLVQRGRRRNIHAVPDE